jgi:hypothetical protein
VGVSWGYRGGIVETVSCQHIAIDKLSRSDKNESQLQVGIMSDWEG